MWVQPWRKLVLRAEGREPMDVIKGEMVRLGSTGQHQQCTNTSYVKKFEDEAEKLGSSGRVLSAAWGCSVVGAEYRKHGNQ